MGYAVGSFKNFPKRLLFQVLLVGIGAAASVMLGYKSEVVEIIFSYAIVAVYHEFSESIDNRLNHGPLWNIDCSIASLGS